MKYWHEVPKENRDELKQKLFQTIILFGNGPKIVLNRLCIAVSGFCNRSTTHTFIRCNNKFIFSVERFYCSYDYRISYDHWRHCDHISKSTNAKCITRHTTMDTDGSTWWHTRRGEYYNFNPKNKILTIVAIIIYVLLNDNFVCFVQSQVMFASVQRAAVRNEVCKRTPFVINIVEQFILSKLDQTWSDNDMSTLLRAVKCAESWLKYVKKSRIECMSCLFLFFQFSSFFFFFFWSPDQQKRQFFIRTLWSLNKFIAEGNQ